MNTIRTSSLWAIGAIVLFWVTAACNKPCDPNLNAVVGEEFFTVEYQDATGTNYLDIYNPDGVVVFLDTTGGTSATPRFELITPGFENGKFGPFEFTEKFTVQQTNEINLPLLFGKPFQYDYFIKKDTYGQDTITVSFLLEADECNYNWTYIRYAKNGEPLPQYENQTQVNMVFVE
ncbi:MAG: hypothetical protein AAF399_15380 [Bacteroidota bacterium]